MPAEVDSSHVEMEKSTDAEDSCHKSTIKDKSGAGSKHPRKRKRKHFNTIREQMEFYFGDANLSKDRFLKQLIDKDPYVPLDVFLSFNKMKAIASSVDEIAKSLTNSQLLELDEAQQKVRRKTALPVERDVDDKTLYVESLPPSADHDWVKQIFTRFGNVTYVSLPKYAKSRKIKEFGFIEFEKQESVAKAVKAFQEFKGVLCMQGTDPSELKSVKAFIKEQNNEAETAEDSASEDKEKKKQNRKRHKNKTDTGEECPNAKKIKTDVDDSADSTASENESSASATAEETQTANEAEPAESGDELSKKKRRKKKKKSKKVIDKRKRDVEQSSDANFYDLKVLPKRDWKRLRNKYLNLQREKIAELKRKAWKEAQQQQQSRENLMEGVENVTTATQPTKKQPKSSERKLHKMNMNFYGAGDADTNDATTKVYVEKDIKQNPAQERAPLFNYEPGLIVEVNFLEPCVTVKEFKADMRQYSAVKYVDVKEGGMHAHLRLETADASNDFVKQVSCAEYKCKPLAGELEAEYWRKIEQDREMKLNKKVKVPQKRGREKVKKLVTKHIRFGDEDEE